MSSSRSIFEVGLIPRAQRKRKEAKAEKRERSADIVKKQGERLALKAQADERLERSKTSQNANIFAGALGGEPLVGRKRLSI